MDHTVAVYSCFFGDPEPFNPASMGDGEGYDRVLFTDSSDLRPSGIRVVEMSSEELGPVFESRRAKMMPHILLPEYDWVIYIDNRASLNARPADIIRRIEQSYGSNASGRFLFRHLERKTAREEADMCFFLGHLDESQWRELIRFYEQIELSTVPDLTHNAVMICKQGDAKTEEVSELWFELFQKYGRRDQLTLQPAEHLIGATATRLDFPLSEIANWPIYRVRDRAKRVQSSEVREKPFILSTARLKYYQMMYQRKKLIRSMFHVAR
ncbi:glycosyltransferase domain-containing protein [Roseovarius sp.]|uniref:glycosyltransferase domain-containing protein n=1 Tax=Roseovarius sp. TaxID=1486281 RepID=UPI003A97BC80